MGILGLTICLILAAIGFITEARLRAAELKKAPVYADCRECGSTVKVASSPDEADSFSGQVRPYACSGCGTAFFVDFSGGFADRMTEALAAQEQTDFDIGVQNRHGGFSYPRKDIPDA